MPTKPTPLTTAQLPLLPPRAWDCHKGQLGHVLVVAGGTGMGGAGLLASQASLRLGAGLVTLATKPEHLSASLTRQPEVMAYPLIQPTDLAALLPHASVILIGPGLGQDDWALELLLQVANSAITQIWDADALNLLAQQPHLRPQTNNWLLTPHPGEAARLLNCSTAQVQSQRVQAALALTQRYQATVILKGAHSLIAAPEQRLQLCTHGHPVMAGAGFGDVLGGVIAAFTAQGLNLYDASCLAVYIHARTGELCANQGRGLAAHELIAPMRQLLEQISPISNP